MNDPQDSAIEPVASDPPESADSGLSDEALDRPQGWGKISNGSMPSLDRPAG